MFLFLTFLIIFILVRRGNFTSLFFSLSYIYFTFFYIYPLLLINHKEGFYYASYYFSVNKNEIIFAFFSAVALIIGFLIPDMFFILKKRKLRVLSDFRVFIEEAPPLKKFNKLFYLILILVVSYYAYGALDANRALDIYEIRNGATSGNVFTYLTSSLIGSLFFSLVFSLIYLKKNGYLTLLFMFRILYLITGSTGRLTLSINIIYFIIHTFKVKPKTIVLASTFLVILFMPILLNMKSIIYSISVESTIPNLIDIYLSEPELEGVITNFGHPLVSLMKANELVDKIGFRFFYDYLQGFLFYLRVFGLDFGDSLLYYNTENLIGKRLSIIPTGYLAFGYIQLGYFGIIVSGAFYRITGLIAEYSYYSTGVQSNLIKFYFAFLAASSFYHGEIRVMVMTFFLPLIVLYIFRPSRLTKYV